MANAASGYVVPAGRYLFHGLTGEDPSGNSEWRGASNIFDIGDPRGMFGSVTDAWNAQRLGYGTIDAPPGLGMAADEAMRRYAGDPNNGGAGGWQARWDQWNATDLTGPDGQTLLSPVHATGLRIGQGYGGRNYDGSPIEAGDSDMWNTALGVRNNLNSDPYLDPGNQLAGLRAMTSSSAYGMPNPGDYTSGMRSAIGGPNDTDAFGQRGLSQNRDLAAGTDFDRYGMRGIDQTNALEEANVRQLMRGIDREAQLTIGEQIPEVQQQMATMGLGRSGAGQSAVLGSMRSVLEQANRDKQRTMADFQDRSANRRATAINLATQQGYGGESQKYGALSQAMNLGSQIGAQGQGQYADQMGRAFLAGQGDLFAANQQGRQNEQALWSQAMQNRFAKNQGDQNALYGMLTNSGVQLNDRLRMEDQGRSAALADWLALQGNRDQTQQNSLNQMLTLRNAQRQIQQDRLNQMLQAGMLPLDWMGRIATGTTAPSGPAPQNNSFWNSGLGRSVGNIGAQAVGAYLNSGGPPRDTGYNTFTDF